MKLLQQIDEMRGKLNDISGDEKTLVKALGDALNRLDQQLLHDVRNIATDHEARREAILAELQSLAAGIGMFRPPLEGPAASDEAPSYVSAPAHHQSLAPGDWRQAASNIEDELDQRLNGRNSPH
jgi:hypothetical protein